jgi:hypothetical protein
MFFAKLTVSKWVLTASRLLTGWVIDPADNRLPFVRVKIFSPWFSSFFFWAVGTFPVADVIHVWVRELPPVSALGTTL